MPTTRRTGFLATLLVAALLAALAIWPQLVGAQRLQVVAQLIPFRGLLAIVFAVLGAVAALTALLRRRWGVAAALAIALAAASVGNGAVLLTRGGGGPVAEGELTVAAWNTYGGGASPESIARLVRETGAEVVVLPETDAIAAGAVVDLLAQGGIGMTAATREAEPGDDPVPTSILIATAMGPYALDPSAGSTPGVPSGVYRPVDGDGPTLVAAHPLPPLPLTMSDWTDGMDWVAAQCSSPDVILAGDLNATLDHLAGLGEGDGTVGRCRDAAAEAQAAAVGTWPIRLPPALAAPIDHVLVGSAWEVSSFEVRTDFDDAGSDHRPIVATVKRRWAIGGRAPSAVLGTGRRSRTRVTATRDASAPEALPLRRAVGLDLPLPHGQVGLDGLDDASADVERLGAMTGCHGDHDRRLADAEPPHAMADRDDRVGALGSIRGDAIQGLLGVGVRAVLQRHDGVGGIGVGVAHASDEGGHRPR